MYHLQLTIPLGIQLIKEIEWISNFKIASFTKVENKENLK